MQVMSLEKQLAESTLELREVQERINASPQVIQKYNELQAELRVAKDEYQAAVKAGNNSDLTNLAKLKMAAKQSEFANFSKENQGRLPENFSGNMEEVQTRQAAIATLNQKISDEKQRQTLLESELSNNKSLQSQIQANLYVPAPRGRETRVMVDSNGKIVVRGREFAASGLTPAQLEAAIGARSSVRIEESASQIVTVLVPLNGSRDRFHVSGEVTAGQQVMQSFETDSTGQPALAKAIPLRAGSYHLVVVVKNMASGASHRSALDFTVD
jgi:hypothetical protein